MYIVRFCHWIFASKTQLRKLSKILFLNTRFHSRPLIFAQNFRAGMISRLFKTFTVAAFSIFCGFFSVPAHAGGGEGDSTHKKKSFNAEEIIFGHILDGHEFHFFDIIKKDGTKKPVGIPLPVILYSPQRGLDVFMSSKFHHGHENYKGYAVLTEHKIAELKLDPQKYFAGQIVPVTESGAFDPKVKVYDVSLTRNVVQMLLALGLLVWIMLSVAKRYKKGEGITTAPKGMQNTIETVVNFVKDEVAKPNLGHKYTKYLPLLLTMFFFILINNIFGSSHRKRQNCPSRILVCL